MPVPAITNNFDALVYLCRMRVRDWSAAPKVGETEKIVVDLPNVGDPMILPEGAPRPEGLDALPPKFTAEQKFRAFFGYGPVNRADRVLVCASRWLNEASQRMPLVSTLTQSYAAYRSEPNWQSLADYAVRVLSPMYAVGRASDLLAETFADDAVVDQPRLGFARNAKLTMLRNRLAFFASRQRQFNAELSKWINDDRKIPLCEYVARASSPPKNTSLPQPLDRTKAPIHSRDPRQDFETYPVKRIALAKHLRLLGLL